MSYELARWTHDDVRVIRSRNFLWFPIHGPALCCQHFLCFILRNRSIQMTIAHVSKACWSSFFLKFQNKDLGAAFQTLLTEVKLRLRRNLPLIEKSALKWQSNMWSRPPLHNYKVTCIWMFLSGRGPFLIFTVVWTLSWDLHIDGLLSGTASWLLEYARIMSIIKIS